MKLDAKYHWRTSFFNIKNAPLSRSAMQEMEMAAVEFLVDEMTNEAREVDSGPFQSS